MHFNWNSDNVRILLTQWIIAETPNNQLDIEKPADQHALLPCRINEPDAQTILPVEPTCKGGILEAIG